MSTGWTADVRGSNPRLLGAESNTQATMSCMRTDILLYIVLCMYYIVRAAVAQVVEAGRIVKRFGWPLVTKNAIYTVNAVHLTIYI